MPKDQRKELYDKYKLSRLFSFFETLPGRFGTNQWKYVTETNENISSEHCPRARGDRRVKVD